MTDMAGVFADLDSKNATGFAARMSEGGRVRIGSFDAVTGRSEIEKDLTRFFGTIEAVRHDTVAQWEVGDGITIVESSVTYTRLDGGKITAPAVSVVRRGPELIDDYRIFIDLAPVFA